MTDNNKSLLLKYVKLTEEAKEPKYATDGSGCFDLYSTNNGLCPRGGSFLYGTGIAVQIPEGFAMLVFSRSGHGFKHGVRLANCVGVIDSDYRGELMVKLSNDTDRDLMIEKGERIAQAMIVPYPKVEFQEVGSLVDTVRGDGGFGSTGVQ